VNALWWIPPYLGAVAVVAVLVGNLFRLTRERDHWRSKALEWEALSVRGHKLLCEASVLLRDLIHMRTR
jgi:hypothetical protein